MKKIPSILTTECIKLEEVIKKVITQARENSNEGNWVVYLNEFDEETKKLIRDNKGLLEDLFTEREEIAEISIDDECIDITIWLKYCYWWEVTINKIKKYLMKVYFTDRQNTIFEEYRKLQSTELEDNIENFVNVILKDETFLYQVNELECSNIDEYLEEGLTFSNFHIMLVFTLGEYMSLYRNQYNDGELWDFSLLEIWDGTIEANHNMRYWAIVDEFGELRIFETYDFEEFEEKE